MTTANGVPFHEVCQTDQAETGDGGFYRCGDCGVAGYSDDIQVVVRRTDTWAVVNELSPARGSLYAIAWSPGKLLAIGGRGMNLVVRDASVGPAWEVVRLLFLGADASRQPGDDPERPGCELARLPRAL